MPQWQTKATAVLGAGLALGLLCERRPPGAELRAELAAALGSCRPLEGRVSGLAYAPFPECPKPTPGRRKTISRIRLQLDNVERKARAAFPITALLQIAAHDWNAAARSLRLASAGATHESNTNRARLESDRASVALAQASRGQDPYELTSALTAADRAVHLDPRLPEASFNLALVEERLFLLDHSVAEWKRYLTLDPSSPWATEAKNHLATLGQVAARDWPGERRRLDSAALGGDPGAVARIVARFRQEARLYAEDTLFGEWAGNIERGNARRAADSMRRLTAVAVALREQTGDRLVDEAVKALSNPSRQRELVDGHLAYARARSLMAGDQLVDAGRSLRPAQRSLARAGSPLALWAIFQQAVIAYREKHQEEALRTASGLIATATAHSYFALAGRAGWLVGLILLERAEASAAIEVLQPALAQFDHNGEVSHQGSILSILATSYEYLGNTREAWKFRWRALEAILRSGDSARGAILFGTAAQALAKEGMPELGLLYEDEVLTRELASGKALGIAETYWIRGMIHHQAGAGRQAAADLEAASRYCRQIGAAAARLHTEAVIASTQGAVERERDPASAVRTLTRSLLAFQSESFPFLKVEVLFDRALAFLALGDLPRAEHDLAAGIAEYEKQRRQMRGISSRVSFFDRAEQIFDVMIRFQLDRRRRPDLAFAYAERAKARSLLDALAPSPKTTADAASALASLPPTMALIELHVMAERSLIWILCRGQLSLIPIDVPAARIADLVATLSSAARTQGGEPAFQAASSELYDLLIAPLADKLPPGVGLAFVTDKELQGVPLAALFNRRTGRFLVQDRPILVAASASTYCLGLRRVSPPATARAPFTALAVGGPEPDRARFQDLGPLPAAAREAERIAALYPGSVVLRGNRATVARFLQELDRHELVQFAGHAIFGSSQQARLVFTKPSDGSDLEELDAGTIAGLRLRRPRLVLLSACAAGSGPAARLEGTASLARAFLAAGVPVVLANLWTVDDDVALAFSDRFHASFERSRDALTALQNAQAAMLASPDAKLRSPAAWAGFELFGAAVLPSAAAARPALSLRSPPP